MSRVELFRDGERIARVDYDTAEIHWTEALVDAGIMTSDAEEQWGQPETAKADGSLRYRHVRESLTAVVRG